MKTTGRLVAATLALALALAACTDDGGEADGATAGTGPSATGPTGRLSVPPGSNVYRYVNAGLEAILDLDAGTLEIANGTGRELPPPGLYALDARDGAQVDGQVADAASIPDGETVTFRAQLDGIEPRNIGLVILLMGDDNYGAFVRQ